MEDNKKKFDPADLPDPPETKEIYQYPPAPDQGKPLDDHAIKNEGAHEKQADKTSHEEGLNEERSEGNVGAFEGFEDQQCS